MFLYNTNPCYYKKLLIKNITKVYKISNKKIIKQMNLESQEIIYNRNTLIRKYYNSKTCMHL